MSHTSTFEIEGRRISIVHNGGWMGEARIVIYSGLKDTDPREELRVPAALFVQVAKRLVSQAIVGLTEDGGLLDNLFKRL